MFSESTKAISFYISIGGGSFLIFVLKFLIVYIGIKICFFALQARHSISQTYSFSDTRLFLKTSAIFQIILALTLIVMGLVLTPIITAPDQSHIAENSDKMMNIDRAIFGTYPGFSMQSASNPYKSYWDSAGKILIKTYTSLAILICFLFILHIATNHRIFVSMMIAFFLSMAFSAPFWYTFPALTPGERYIDNAITNNKLLPANIYTAVAAYQPNQNILQFRKEIAEEKDKLGNKFADVTQLPSMHVAWALVALYFGFLAWRKLLYVLAPYFMFTVLATMYTLQHFGVDAIGGVLIGTVAIIVAESITKNLKKDGGLTYFIRKDIEIIMNGFDKIYRKYSSQKV